MSRGIKVLWIVIGCGFFIGVVLTGTAFALGATGAAWIDRSGLHMGLPQTEEMDIRNLESEAFSAVDVELLEADVELVVGEAYGYEFSYRGNQEPTVEIKDDTLHVVELGNNWRVNLFGFWRFWEDQSAKLTVYVPADAALDLVKLYMASGSTTLAGSGVRIASLDCKSASGDIDLSSLALERLRLDVASGDVHLSAVAANEATINLVSGWLEYRGASLDNLVLSMASGSAFLEGRVSQDLRLSLVSGDVDLELEGSKDDYSFNVNRISGNVWVNGGRIDSGSWPSSATASEGAAGHIDIDTASGSITLTFT